jgi:hypothetical protein
MLVDEHLMHTHDVDILPAGPEPHDSQLDDDMQPVLWLGDGTFAQVVALVLGHRQKWLAILVALILVSSCLGLSGLCQSGTPPTCSTPAKSGAWASRTPERRAGVTPCRASTSAGPMMLSASSYHSAAGLSPWPTL